MIHVNPDQPLIGMCAQDKITGFSGRITGVVFYITGCHQALVQPSTKDSGDMSESHWIDLQRLIVRENERLTFDNTNAGFDKAPPKI